MLAIAARLPVERAPATEARCAAVYPALVRNHLWWEHARDPGRTGLVCTLHPWESGMDNSPAWDGPMARVPTATTPVVRRDTGHVDPAFEPLRYWRGPIWPVVNRMISDGLAWAGEVVLAARGHVDTAALIDTAGPCEYFDPTTGAGAGARIFPGPPRSACCSAEAGAADFRRTSVPA